MAARLTHESPKVRDLVAKLAELRMAEDQRSTSSQSEEQRAKFSRYCQVTKETFQSPGNCPKVTYEQERSCICCFSTFRDVCQRICNRININCCGTMYVKADVTTTEAENSFHLITEAHMMRPTDHRVNQYTNTGFYCELFQEYGEELEYIFPVALNFLPRNVKRFWLEWDPYSTDPLPLSKANTLKRLLREASDTLQKVRLEMMAKEMKDYFRSSTPKRTREESSRGTRERSAASQGSASSTIDSYTSSEEERSPPAFSTALPQDDGFELLRSYSYRKALEPHEEEMTAAPAPKRVHITVSPGEKPKEFDQKRVMEDVKRIADVTDETARTIAEEVFERIPEECSTQLIWDCLMEVALEMGIAIRPHIYERINAVLSMEKFSSAVAGAKRVMDIPPDIFIEMMGEIREEQEEPQRRALNTRVRRRQTANRAAEKRTDRVARAALNEQEHAGQVLE